MMRVLLSAEAVEKANRLGYFIPVFSSSKTHLTNYNLNKIVVLCYPWPIIFLGG
jgi:hypothetical protein